MITFLISFATCATLGVIGCALFCIGFARGQQKGEQLSFDRPIVLPFYQSSHDLPSGEMAVYTPDELVDNT
jgi:hypothetical protein